MESGGARKSPGRWRRRLGQVGCGQDCRRSSQPRGPEAAQDTGRAWGDPCASYWDRFRATAELGIDASILIAPELEGLKGADEAARGLDEAIAAGRSSIEVDSRAEAEAIAREFVGEDAELMFDRSSGQQVGWINRTTGRVARFAENHGSGWHINVGQLEKNAAGRWSVGKNIHINFPN